MYPFILFQDRIISEADQVPETTILGRKLDPLEGQDFVGLVGATSDVATVGKETTLEDVLVSDSHCFTFFFFLGKT